jgi:hypothetical protein
MVMSKRKVIQGAPDSLIRIHRKTIVPRILTEVEMEEGFAAGI